MERFRNTFDGGLDTNIANRLLPPNKYIDAANVNLVASGNFFALENIKGTEKVSNIILENGTYEILAVYETKYKIGEVSDIPCLTFFTAIQDEESAEHDSTFKIWCYNTLDNSLYELYERAIEGDYFADDRVVDGIRYPENGIDILYFTDNYFKIGKLRCEIPLPYTANFLDELDVQLQRRGAKGLVELVDIVEGGSLFAGSYQIAYQLIHPDTNQFTKFSLFCNPIQIFLKPTDVFEKVRKSGVGLQSNYKIKMNINLSDEEAAYYTHFRLAILENIEPKDVTVTQVRLTAMESMAEFINGSVLEDVEYNANIRLESVDVAEVVVDLLAMNTGKTLSIRQNRLLAGNVTYKELEYDNGEPTITGGEVVKRVSDITKNSFSDPVFASKYRGHFRDEVYRFAISYFDEDMNFSFPKVLDLSSIVFNQFGVEDTIITPNPELLNDPGFNNGFNWPQMNYTADDPADNPPLNVGIGATATFGSGFDTPISSHYIRNTLSLDSTKTYNYILNVTLTISGYVPYISFWNDTTLLSEFPASGSGSFSPPASTTHVGLRVFGVSGSGTFTFTDFSIKESVSISIPPVTVTGFDIKFPSRKAILSGETFTLFGEGGKIQSLGVQLEGIDNHPTWARGFVILRARRIKDILFQTPMIPMNSIYAVGALEEYPQQANELSGTGRRTITYDSAQPMGPFTTYVPRNYHWNRAQNISMFSVAGGATGGGLNKKFTGEAELTFGDSYILGMVFPPSFMYESNPFTFNPTFKFTPVDAMIANKDNELFSTPVIGSAVAGRNIKTSISTSLYGLRDEQYYYDSNHGGVKPDIIDGQRVLQDYKEFINFGEGTTVAGYDVFRYDKLETPGFFWGIKGNAHKCGVVKLGSPKIEINNDNSLDFAAGSQTFRTSVPTQAFQSETTRAQTIEIGNVTVGLEDTRYGKIDTPHEFIFTGTLVTFSDVELEDVVEGNSLPKTVEVWGGDCYVSPHLFKLTDTCYGTSNSEKFEGLGGLDLTNGVRNWEKSFNDLEVASETNMALPVPYKNAAQYIQVVMESEYNAGVFDNEIISEITTTNDDFVIHNVSPSSEGSCRVPLTYELNPNHKKQNDDKIFRIKDPLLETNNRFVSRLVYTDQKVYQTSINGFDIFRVLNFFDLEETYGPIHSLALSGDELYSLQHKAIVYIGIGERLLETTEALQLSVQSGSFIGNVMYIDVDRGTQNLKSVLKTGNAVYFSDVRNKTFNRLSNKTLDVLSEMTMASTFRDLFEESIPENRLLTLYDPTNKQIWVYSNDNPSFCLVYDEARNIWISKYGFPTSTLKGGVYSNQDLYLMGKLANGLDIFKMYTGSVGQLFGSPAEPYVISVVNPSMEFAKTFDAILLVSSEPLKTFDMSVERPQSILTQQVLDMDLNIPTRGESNYRVAILRGAGNARLRGHAATVKLKWHTISDDVAENISVRVPSFLTEYRISENRF